MSDQTITGFVSRLSTKSGNGQHGPWTAYSARIQEKSGEELPYWFQFGFKAVPFEEGDYIQFQATPKDDSAMSARVETVKISSKPPPKPAPVQRGNASSSGGGGRGGTGGSSRDNYWAQKEKYDREHTEPRIHFQSARRDAISFFEVLLSKDAIPVSKAQGKAKAAERFEEMNDILDKLTVRFFDDTQELRVIEAARQQPEDVQARPDDLPDSDEFEEGGTDDGFDNGDDFNDDIPEF